MEMATDEPTPTASHQELSGSNTGHFTVTYDSEDTNYCAQGLAGEKVQVYVGLEVSLRGLLCRWLTTISSGHCVSERVWTRSRERGRKTFGHQHEVCAKMKFPAQKNTGVNGTTSLAVIVGPKCLIAHLLAPHDRAFSLVFGVNPHLSVILMCT